MIKIHKTTLQAAALILALGWRGWARADYPKPEGRVNDFAHVLDDSAKATLKRLIDEVDQTTTAEIGVVTVQTLNGEPIESYANGLFRAWGIGKKDKNNGVLLLVAVADRRMRIEVGYGLEPILPDGLAGDIIRQELRPAFKRGDYAGGIIAGVQRIGDIVSGKSIPSAPLVQRFMNAPSNPVDDAAERRKNKASVWTALAVLACATLGYIIVWWRVGKDPAAGQIILRCEPPDDLSAPAAPYIQRMGFDNTAFTSALLDAAVKGDLAIDESGGVYTLRSLANGSRGLWDGETKAVDALFFSTKTLELKQENHVTLQTARSALESALKFNYEKAYFVTNRNFFIRGIVASFVLFYGHALWYAHNAIAALIAIFFSIWLSGWTVGTGALLFAVIWSWWSLIAGKKKNKAPLAGAIILTVFLAPFMCGEVFAFTMVSQATSLGSAILLVSLVALNALFYYLLKAPTHLGRQVLDQIEGFKLYLKGAEPAAMRSMPEKTTALFEKYLPYAMALDVQEDWARQFDHVLAASSANAYTPTWYCGSRPWNQLGVFTFVGIIGSSLSSAVSSASASPHSSSSGGGGGFGGGSSGGGGASGSW